MHRRRKCSKQSPLWLSVQFSHFPQSPPSLRQATARGLILIHIRPSSAAGIGTTRARIARVRARNGCAIITAPRSKGRFRAAQRATAPQTHLNALDKCADPSSCGLDWRLDYQDNSIRYAALQSILPMQVLRLCHDIPHKTH